MRLLVVVVVVVVVLAIDDDHDVCDEKQFTCLDAAADRIQRYCAKTVPLSSVDDGVCECCDNSQSALLYCDVCFCSLCHIARQWAVVEERQINNPNSGACSVPVTSLKIHTEGCRFEM